jgi:hypothetical protein
MQDLENKGDNLQDLQNAGVTVSLELWGDTSLRLLDSVSTYVNYTWWCQGRDRIGTIGVVGQFEVKD